MYLTCYYTFGYYPLPLKYHYLSLVSNTSKSFPQLNRFYKSHYQLLASTYILLGYFLNCVMKTSLHSILNLLHRVLNIDFILLGFATRKLIRTISYTYTPISISAFRFNGGFQDHHYVKLISLYYQLI